MAVHTIPQGSVKPDQFIADVESLKNNSVTVVHWRGAHYAIDVCMATVHEISVGDRVLVQIIDDLLVVTQHFLAPDQARPVLRCKNDIWVLESNHPLSLQVGQQVLTLSSDGEITLEAEDITSQARGNNRLFGSRIELN